MDFTQGVEIYERIATEINGLEIGILINNVGMSYKYPEYLDQVLEKIIMLVLFNFSLHKYLKSKKIPNRYFTYSMTWKTFFVLFLFLLKAFY